MSYLKKINQAALQRKITLTKKAQNEIFNTFDVAITDLSRQLTSAQGFQKAFIQNRMRALHEEMEELINEYSLESAKAAADVHKDTLQKIGNMAGLDVDFQNTFGNIPSEALKAMKSAEMYKDGMDLSKRIWNITQQSGKQIEEIIYSGIAQGTNAVDLAKLLQEHVNPLSRKVWDNGKIKELLGDGYAWANKQIEYNALRLARTSIAHTFTLSNKLSAQKNPFVEKMRWHSVFAHGRTCSICKERDGKEYTIKDLPFDHPNGMCWEEPIYDKSLDLYAKELRDWVDGKPNDILDNWFTGEDTPIIKRDERAEIEEVTPEYIREQLKNLPVGTKRYVEKYDKLVDKLIQSELNLNQSTPKVIKWGDATQEGLSYSIGNKSYTIPNKFASKRKWLSYVERLKDIKDYDTLSSNLPKFINEAMTYDRKTSNYKGALGIVKELQKARTVLEQKPPKLKVTDLPSSVLGKAMRDRIIPKVVEGKYNANNPTFMSSYNEAIDFLTTKIDKATLRSVRREGFQLQLLERNSRAYARGNISIHIAENTQPSSIIHETGHIIHNSDAELTHLVKGWFDLRTKGEELKPIYKNSKEVGYKDDFINQYIGKVYNFKGGDQGLEVISMGLQYMFEDPAAFYEKDPSHFRLIYGMIRGCHK